ncbi:O-methyltransferase MdmC-like isoform X2 [Ptychodera flava]|uniref:O-methyltransferase MdmC-like isoform X2 n=1 Tax=Ptychodera flava TaxID=63121 RepID=UPI00396A1130
MMSLLSSLLTCDLTSFACAVCTGAAVAALGYKFTTRKGQDEPWITSNKQKSFMCENDPETKYLIEHSLREHPILADLRKATIKTFKAEAFMMCPPEECQFFTLLLKMLNARKVIEIGTFTGYNALSMALTIPSDGKVVACDIERRFADFGRNYWKKLGVDGMIDLRIQPALNTLDDLLRAGEAGTFDFIFVDADKEVMVEYYEKSLQLLRKGGIVALDNVMWYGTVYDPTNDTAFTRGTRAVNEVVKKDSRVDISMLLIADGVTLARKK